MAERFPREFADEDPEYDADAAADVDAEASEFEPADPKTIPADEGDVGNADLPDPDRNY